MASKDKFENVQHMIIEQNEDEPIECVTIPSYKRDNWGKSIEFLMSCIAMSVGLGNVWRFPFVALENGGGAFVIPYIIILLLVGKPLYFMEMLIGQFSSRGSVKIYDFAPAMRGVGFGQLVALACLTTYYGSVMAVILSYMVDSVKSPLPWSYCRPEWNTSCLDSGLVSSNLTMENVSKSSSELYFLKEVLHEKNGIDDGIGLPDLKLVICLAFSWTCVMFTMVKGVKSSGKVSYFLALFPYVLLITLLVRACTLPGAWNGIVYFLKPQWDQLLNPKVWYNAVTQVFFSLAVCFGPLIMYSSYNKFGHNLYRDVKIVTTIDTFTSLIAGCTIFGILGNLAHRVGTEDISKVVKGGTGLAFISYPEAIAKFEVLPQVFSFLFFFMLFILGIGSNVAMMSSIMTVIRDELPKVKNWQAALLVGVIGFSIGTIYVTPGGQYVLNLVDFFCAGFIAFVLAIGEVASISWIYGVDRFCDDCEFMLGFRPNRYWRWCWRVITPVLLICILTYTLINFELVKYGDYIYPNSAYAFGTTMALFGLLQIPIWACYAIIKQKSERWSEAFEPAANWGPRDPELWTKYQESVRSKEVLDVSNRMCLWMMKR